MTTITGTARALVSKYTRFDPANRSATPAARFTLISMDSDLNYWTGDGYVEVGTADITVHVLPRDECTQRAVVALRSLQSKVRADAEAKATEIEGRIQSLLAITNEVAA